MSKYGTSMYYDADPERVFSVMTDLEHVADHIEDIVKLEVLTDGPIGRGTRFRETRMMFKKEATQELEITEWDPPRSYTVECEACGCWYKSIITCAPDGDGARLEMSMHMHPVTFMAKIMSPFMRPLFANMCSKTFKKDLSDLKNAVEGQSHAPQPA